MARQTQNPSTKRRSPIAVAAICCLVLVVIVAIAIFITWLAIKPKNIQYSVDEGWINNYNLTSNNELTSTFNFNLRTYNPNHKTSVYYDKMEVTVYYRGQNVGSNLVAPFYQPKDNVTRLMLQIPANGVKLSKEVVHDLKVERTGGEVDLDIKVKAKIKFKVGIFKTRHYKLKVLCSPVVVNFSNDSRFQAKDCDVDI